MRQSGILIIVALVALPLAVMAQGLSSEDCLGCHSDPSLTMEVAGKSVSVHVPQEKFEQSVHGAFGCTDCHSDITDYPHEPAPAKVDCGNCHPDAKEAYERGLHATARDNGDKGAATCFSCHGGPHEILSQSNPSSKTYRTNLPDTCGACHGVKFVMEPSGFSIQPFFSYRESVHGRAVSKGSQKAAVCIDCHDSHEIRTPRDPASPIFKFNVPATCGKCHEKIAKEYKESIHGQAITRGNWESPVCTDCHGIHAIKAPIDPSSSVAIQAIARSTCSRCHAGVKLTQEFGVPAARVSSYRDSYHGLANQFGSSVAANCASCHGVHNILPSSDPRSTINKANLVKTCGVCHHGATANFAKGNVHLDVPASHDVGSVGVRWIRWFYIWLIVLVIGGMVLHNVLIWWRKASAKRKFAERRIIRMNLNQRIQHWLLLSSFMVLVFTGFALAYPNSWLGMFLGSSESVRRWGHRVAGAVMLLAGFYHVWYMLFTPEGRQTLRDLLPRMKDARDVIDNLGYYGGRWRKRPQMDRFTYGEKAEYWALVWGTVIMGVTGLMLWFKVDVSMLMPRWWIDLATAIHFYEAILASLAIVVWHFYQVIFDPDVYPMNWAWWDGRMSDALYEHEHPLAARKLDEAKAGEGNVDEARVMAEAALPPPDESDDENETEPPPSG